MMHGSGHTGAFSKRPPGVVTGLNWKVGCGRSTTVKNCAKGHNNKTKNPQRLSWQAPSLLALLRRQAGAALATTSPITRLPCLKRPRRLPLLP